MGGLRPRLDWLAFSSQIATDENGLLELRDGFLSASSSGLSG
jgi:hypothetical protein